MPASAGVGFFAFVLLVVAAAFTSFYSWRLIFMTFHGAPRAPKDVMDHAHESPQVMLVPLYILAAGALFAGLIFAGYFIGEELCGVLEGLARRRTRICSRRCTTPPFWIAALPTIAMLLGFGVAYRFYIRAAGGAGAARRGAAGPLPLPAEQVVLRRDLRRAAGAPGDGARPLPLEEGRRLADRRLWAGRRVGARHRCDAERGPAADRLPLPLRLRDAARRRAPRHLDDVRGMTPVDELAHPLRPSPILPLAGAAIIFFCSSAARGRQSGGTS